MRRGLRRERSSDDCQLDSDPTLDCDGDGQIDSCQLQAQYSLVEIGTVALPTYAIVNPSDQEKTIVQISGVVPTERFAAFLDQGKASYLQQNLALGE